METTTPPPVRFPPQIKYIIGNEACERFSYYGMIGILENYLKDRMSMGADHATEVLHVFAGAAYFVPLLGGWLADRWLGRYWTILIISLFYCLGHGTLAASEGSRAGLYAGLALIAIGAGGIKPCVSAFVGDQFGPNDERALTKVYSWFYWAINLGSAAAFLVIPFIKEKYGYSWAFAVPGMFMALATLFFWLGRKQYVRQPPARLAPARSAAEKAEARKAVWRIVGIFITVPFFWALFNQSNSTWVLQGGKMTPLNLGGYLVDGERMQASGAILVMIWVPIFTMLVFPFLERIGWKPTALRRMSAGMVLGAVSFVICGLVQARLDHGATLSIGWQLAPYFVLEAGEVLLSATALEFAFSQSPPSMKSLVTSFWLMAISGGHFLVALFTSLKVAAFKYLAARGIQAQGAPEFYFYAALMFVVSAVFIIIAMRYRESKFTTAGL